LCTSVTRAPEPLKRLRHLATDRPAADDHEARGQCGDLEEGVIGEGARFLQPWNRRQLGPAAGGDHGAGEAQRPPIHVNGVAPGEAGRPEIHVHPESGEMLDRVRRADAGSQPAHPLHDRPKIHRHALRHPNPIRVGALHGRRDAGRGDDPLGGHAAAHQAVAAGQVPLDQRDAPADRRTAGRRR
jgi:hypothetical protein